MTSINIDADLAFSASAYRPTQGTTAPIDTEGFNEYGVRVNEGEDGSVESVDVIFRAMEPGLRKDIRVTESFLAGVAADFSGPIPAQYDHDKSQRSNVGSVYAAWSSDALYLASNIPNTGSSIRADTIADFTHEPPAITDGSVGFGRDYEIEYNEAADEYQFVSASLNEFSFTPFPAGYDRKSGGLAPAFSEAFDSLFYDGGDGPVRREWGEGDIVQWQAIPDAIGAVSHIDAQRQVAMVSLHNEEGSDLMPTGYTVTAGYDDVVPYDGTATPVAPEDLESEYSTLVDDGEASPENKAGESYMRRSHAHIRE